MYLDNLELCKFILLCIHQEYDNWAAKFTVIKSFLEKKGLKNFFILFIRSKPISKEDRGVLSKLKVFYLLDIPNCQNSITQEIIKFSNSLKESLPMIKPDSKDSEYVEYSDELFPAKEELKISKTEGGWEVKSQRLNYWSERIPQTTTHNIERLKVKLKVLEIMKKIKQSGGHKGEKITIGNFETEIY